MNKPTKPVQPKTVSVEAPQEKTRSQEYFVLARTTAFDLGDAVSDELDKGSTLVGGVSACAYFVNEPPHLSGGKNYWYTQAMLRYV